MQTREPRTEHTPSRWGCTCTEDDAWAWLDLVADAALNHLDDDMRKLLPRAGEHYLAVVLREAVRP